MKKEEYWTIVDTVTTPQYEETSSLTPNESQQPGDINSQEIHGLEIRKMLSITQVYTRRAKPTSSVQQPHVPQNSPNISMVEPEVFIGP